MDKDNPDGFFCEKCWHKAHDEPCTYGHSEFHRKGGNVLPCLCGHGNNPEHDRNEGNEKE